MLADWRVIGVLQYFAVSYLIVGMVESLASPAAAAAAPAAALGINDGAAAAAPPPPLPPAETYAPLSASSLSASLWRDVGRYWQQWAAMSAVAALYLGLRNWLPLPDGCPTGYIGPGGISDGGAHRACTGGAARVIDVALFGERHMYHSMRGGVPQSSATCADVYDCVVYDPESSLGWLTASLLTFLGLQAGRVVVHYRALLAGAREPAARRTAVAAHVSRWLLWGVPLALLGGALAGFSQDGGWIPSNKNMWSPSFILIIAGLDFCLLAALFLLVDVAQLWAGAPFVYAGMNSIAVYFLSESFDSVFPFRVTTSSDGDFASHSARLFSNILAVLCWLAVARWMYTRKIFINL